MADALAAPIQRPRHIHSLDGLRALSVLLVVVLHTLQRFSLTHSVPWIFRLFANGTMGVFIFFVISGYLITTLLLREREKTNTISLKSFYVRRAFRILPPLYLYILFACVLWFTGHLPGMNRLELITALTFTRNYVPHVGLWTFEHLWSLCIEEQFYLIWPALLVFCIVRRKCFIRVFSFHFLPNFHNPGAFHMQADGLMFGALGALQQGHARFEKLYVRATRWPWMLPILLFFVSGALGTEFQNYWNMPIGITINGFLVLIWMLWLIRNPESATGRVFNQPVISWVGRLSYSLYIWQTFFLHHRNIEVFGRNGWWNTFPTSWLCILAVAIFSYYVVEQPALRLRDVCLRHMHWHEI
jgi:peptidoglycan/LPS O-acetylase OafA/YrhL